LKELKGFQKIYLNKGESRTVSFTISSNDLKYYHQLSPFEPLKLVSEPGEFKVQIGGSSANVKEAGFSLQ
jgi:beta-glucosidase